jgi:phospholipid-translocating ATPase
VICCRCAPAQKAEITVGLKKILEFGVCAIGDGGNDVRMIQSANVGIGIEGKEGKQAALASDFSVTKFNTILKLTLWHGRLAYMRTALLTNFIFHRGLIVS